MPHSGTLSEKVLFAVADPRGGGDRGDALQTWEEKKEKERKRKKEKKRKKVKKEKSIGKTTLVHIGLIPLFHLTPSPGGGGGDLLANIFIDCMHNFSILTTID